MFSQFIRKLVTAPEVIVFFHLRPLEVPSVAFEDRYHVSRLAIPNCYRLVVRHGYMDEVITPDLASLIFEKVREHIVSRALDREGEGKSASGTDSNSAADATKVNVKNVSEKDTTMPSSSANLKPATSPAASVSSTTSRLTVLERAYNHEVLYIIGKEQMKVKPGTNFLRKALLRAFLFIRENTRTKIASLDVERDRVIEVGFVKDV